MRWIQHVVIFQSGGPTMALSREMKAKFLLLDAALFKAKKQKQQFNGGTRAFYVGRWEPEGGINWRDHVNNACNFATVEEAFASLLDNVNYRWRGQSHLWDRQYIENTFFELTK